MIVSGFWWFELRLIRPFLNEMALFNGEQLSSRYAPQSGAITLMHFGDVNCPCNKFNRPHVEEIQSHYQHQGVRFVAWQQSANYGEILEGFDEVHHTESLAHIPATPAVAIWSKEGQLSYFGPYNSGLICSLGEGFAEIVLDQLAQGLSPEVINTTGTGCFCPTGSVQT